MITFAEYLNKYRGVKNPKTNLLWVYQEVADATDTPVSTVQGYGNFIQNFTAVYKAKFGHEPDQLALVNEWERLQKEPQPLPPVGTWANDNLGISYMTQKQLKTLLHESNMELVQLLRNALKL